MLLKWLNVFCIYFFAEYSYLFSGICICKSFVRFSVGVVAWPVLDIGHLTSLSVVPK